MKILVLGGYGNFGARICRALATDPAIHLLIGGRHLRRATSLASTLSGRVRGVAIDHTAANFSQTLTALGVELLIHTAGPFQAQAYRVAIAAAEAGAHYIDLADGRRFVCDFPQALHATFNAAGRIAVSGASTVPALSSAVVDHLCAGWQRIDSIDTCIAPAQSAPRGRATIAGVLSYCGEPVPVWNNAAWQTFRGWAQPTPVSFAHLKPRVGALCDIPDLEIFPAHYHVKQRVMFRAALEVKLVQQAFAAMASLRTAGLMVSPARLAGILNFVSPALDFLGTALGGMVVRVEGMDAAGKPAKRAWHIAADNDHGPEIPCMAAILLAKKLAHGQLKTTGAFTATGLLSLAEFNAQFVRWGMVTGIVDEPISRGATAQ